MNFRHLKSSELSAVSEFIGGMNACSSLVELERYAHAYLRSLVDGEVTVWNECSWRGEIRHGSTWPEFDLGFWEGIAPAINKYLYQHPTVDWARKNRQPFHASRFWDYPRGGSDFRESELYNEVYRDWGCGESCILSIDTGERSNLIVNVNRESREFSESDLGKFQLLSPFLRDGYHRLKRLDRLNRNLLVPRTGDGSPAYFWLSVGGTFHIRNASENAWSILTRNFPCRRAGFELPVELRSKLVGTLSAPFGGEEQGTETRSFSIRTDSRNLVFTVAPNKGYWLLNGVENGPGKRPVQQSQSVGSRETVSPREADVLAWLCRGKTNPEIAIILRLRNRTVESHVSALLEKFEVTNRAQLIAKIKGLVG